MTDGEKFYLICKRAEAEKRDQKRYTEIDRATRRIGLTDSNGNLTTRGEIIRSKGLDGLYEMLAALQPQPH